MKIIVMLLLAAAVAHAESVKLAPIDSAQLDAEIAKVNQRQAELQLKVAQLQNETQRLVDPSMKKIREICKRYKISFDDLRSDKLRFDAEAMTVSPVEQPKSKPVPKSEAKPAEPPKAGVSK